MNIKLPQTNKDRAIAAVAITFILALVGGVGLSLYQAANHPLGQTSGYAPAQDPQMQRLRRQAGIKD